jgi:hypothetical protein
MFTNTHGPISAFLWFFIYYVKLLKLYDKCTIIHFQTALYNDPIPDMLQQTRLFSASRILAFGYFDPVRPGCCGSDGAAAVQAMASCASYAVVGPARCRLWLLPRPHCHAVVVSPPHRAMAAVVYFFDSTVLGYFLVPLLSLNIKLGLHEIPPFVLSIFSLKFLHILVLVCLYCILH